MRRGGRGDSKGWVTLALALCLGLLGSAARAQGPAAETWPPTSGSWWKSWIGGAEKPAEKPAEEEEELTPLPPSPAERIAAERERQLHALYRRLAVCDQLKQIANDTDNEQLEQQAIEFENRAYVIYHQHIDHLSSPTMTSTLTGRGNRITAGSLPASDTNRPPMGTPGRNASRGEGTR